MNKKANLSEAIKILDETSEILKKHILKYDFFIAGGFPRDLINGDSFGDIDVWPLPSNEVKFHDNVTARKSCYYVEVPPIKRLLATVQCMLKPHSPEELLKHFDMSCCKVAYLPNEKRLIFANDQARQDLLNKLVRIENFHNPFSSIVRVFKLLNKGYRVDLESVLKLIEVYKNSSPIWVRSDSNGMFYTEQLDKLEVGKVEKTLKPTDYLKLVFEDLMKEL